MYEKVFSEQSYLEKKFWGCIAIVVKKMQLWTKSPDSGLEFPPGHFF
jgi:hypothetical protein